VCEVRRTQAQEKGARLPTRLPPRCSRLDCTFLVPAGWQCPLSPESGRGLFGSFIALVLRERVSRIPYTAVSIEDKQAFVAGLASQHGRRLQRFLAARLRNASDVPDLAQEVFLRLLRVQSHESIRTPEAYLLTIAGHVIHQHILRQAAAPESLDILDVVAADEAVLSTPDSAEELDAQRAVQALESVLSELPPNVQACFILQRLYGYSLDEIAARVGIARSTVKKYLVLAITHCQKRLQSKDVK